MVQETGARRGEQPAPHACPAVAATEAPQLIPSDEGRCRERGAAGGPVSSPHGLLGLRVSATMRPPGRVIRASSARTAAGSTNSKCCDGDRSAGDGVRQRQVAGVGADESADAGGMLGVDLSAGMLAVAGRSRRGHTRSSRSDRGRSRLRHRSTRRSPSRSGCQGQLHGPRVRAPRLVEPGIVGSGLGRSQLLRRGPDFPGCFLPGIRIGVATQHADGWRISSR